MKYKTLYGDIEIKGVKVKRNKNKDIVFSKYGYIYTINNKTGQIKRKKI